MCQHLLKDISGFLKYNKFYGSNLLCFKYLEIIVELSERATELKNLLSTSELAQLCKYKIFKLFQN